MNNIFKIVKVHFHLYKNNVLVIQGYFPFDDGEAKMLKSYIDGKESEQLITKNSDNEIRRKYIETDENVSDEYIIEVEVREQANKFELLCTKGDEITACLKLDRRTLAKLRDAYNYNIDSSIVNEGKIRIVGWSACGNREVFKLYSGKKEIPIQVKRLYRKDVIGFFPELNEKGEPGFEIEFIAENYSSLDLKVLENNREHIIRLSAKNILNGGNIRQKKPMIVKIGGKIKREGLKGLIIKERDNEQSPYVEYEEFLKKYGADKEELESQRKEKFAYNPKFSIVVPLFNTPVEYLYEFIDSVLAQTYSNYELCLADGSLDDKLGRLIIEKYSDTRIVYRHLEQNGGISENTNQAINMADGEFIVLSDHDDLLSPNALFECAKAVNKDSLIDVIYSDEDKVSMDGKIYFDPSFKPDFNLDYLRSVNYICHLFVFSREIKDKVGKFRKEFDGAQDHDFILRCVEQSKKIYHIPMVLYHWRCHIDSTAMNLESKLYALDNGAKAVSEHYRRMGIPAVAERSEFYGTYHTIYNWEEKPKVSIIIPNKDQCQTLKNCIDSIERNNKYKNIEYVIVENNSTEKETFEYYEEIKKKDNVTVVIYKGDFNYSAINNYGIRFAKGEMYLLLNNDTSMISGDSIKEMVDTCLRDDVGICGSLLFYPDDTIQHAGVIIGIGGIAGHSFVGLKRAMPGYMYRAAVTQDLTAVTAACLMIKKNVFEEIGGFTEELAVAFNDVDLCLKVRRAGYLVVFNPYSQFYHYESKSRGLEDTPEKISRFNHETEILEKLWPNLLANGDVYYNKNLSLVDGNFKLKK